MIINPEKYNIDLIYVKGHIEVNNNNHQYIKKIIKKKTTSKRLKKHTMQIKTLNNSRVCRQTHL